MRGLFEFRKSKSSTLVLFKTLSAIFYGKQQVYVYLQSFSR